jgi:hypothetical protein
MLRQSAPHRQRLSHIGGTRNCELCTPDSGVGKLLGGVFGRQQKTVTKRD